MRPRSIRARHLAVVLLVVPALAGAQRVGGMGRRGGGGFPGRGNSGDARAATEPQIVNGVNLLIQHRTELALTDSQLVRVVRLKRSLDSTNVPLMRRLDSLQRTTRPSADPTAPANSQDRTHDAQAQMREVVKEVYANIQPVRDRAFALLSADQVERATVIEDRERKEADDAAAAARARTARAGTPPG